jgi:hypothetical protein
MWSLIAIPLTCWLCALVALPRRPLPDNAVQELIYGRLLGRQQRLVLLALVATIVMLLALLATVPRHAGSDLPTDRPCGLAAPDDQPVCGPAQQTDSWAMMPPETP